MVGPGAIGGVVAAALTESGWPVAALARGRTLEALRSGPLRVSEDGRDREVPVRAVARADEAGPAELAIVCVKSGDTGEAGRAVASVLVDGAIVLSFQNGVHNPAALADRLPGACVRGVAVYLGCQRLGPAHVVRRPSRDRATGALRDRLRGAGPGAPGAALRAVAAAVGVPAEVVDPPLALWTKLVANAALNTVTALGRARVGRVFADPAAEDLLVALGREVVAVARASGVPVPVDAAEAYVADARRRLPPDGGSSTLFDLERGRPLEREALVGAVVREADRLGVPVPVSRACDALLRLVDPAASG